MHFVSLKEDTEKVARGSSIYLASIDNGTTYKIRLN